MSKLDKIMNDISEKWPVCNDSRDCNKKYKDPRKGEKDKCRILQSTYAKDGACPFYKQRISYLERSND